MTPRARTVFSAGVALAGVACLLVVLASMFTPTPVNAQPTVRLEGQVQWIAGEKLMLLTYYGGEVDVNISQVPLDQYSTLTQGDHVIVYGVVSEDNRRVNATAVMRDPRWAPEGP